MVGSPDQGSLSLGRLSEENPAVNSVGTFSTSCSDQNARVSRCSWRSQREAAPSVGLIKDGWTTTRTQPPQRTALSIRLANLQLGHILTNKLNRKRPTKIVAASHSGKVRAARQANPRINERKMYSDRGIIFVHPPHPPPLGRAWCSVEISHSRCTRRGPVPSLASSCASFLGGPLALNRRK
jgi:hypothetical protein